MIDPPDLSLFLAGQARLCATSSHPGGSALIEVKTGFLVPSYLKVVAGHRSPGED
jgi:hypothetical protein